MARAAVAVAVATRAPRARRSSRVATQRKRRACEAQRQLYEARPATTRRRRAVSRARRDRSTKRTRAVASGAITAENSTQSGQTNAATRRIEVTTTSTSSRASKDVDGCGARLAVLHSALGDDNHIDESNWMTSTLMDLVLWRFATLYPGVHFLSTDFYHVHLASVSRQRGSRSPTDYAIHDIRGQRIDYCDDSKPIVFMVNTGLIHWNLFRVQFKPQPQLQLFEPMGRLSSRTGISMRSVPRGVLEWLGTCYPAHGDWLSRTVSAITRTQQLSGFDCGVACLLYAEKCGQDRRPEDINELIEQADITRYRSRLQRKLRTMPNTVSVA